jgi:hypothetical protein
MEEKMAKIKQNLKVARGRKKSYDDKVIKNGIQSGKACVFKSKG